MLKIKDSVDLKELEKFGFRNEQVFLQKDMGYITYYINKDTRSIEIWSDDAYEVILDNTIYDLIKANLVEKAEKER